MGRLYHRIRFSPELLDEVVGFCASSPGLVFDTQIRRRLLTTLTTSPDGVLLLADDAGLALVATVVDRMEDPIVPAQLLVLGARADYVPGTFADLVLKDAVSFTRRSGRRGLLAARPSNLGWLHAVLDAAGFVHLYDAYHLRRPAGVPWAEAPSLPEGWRWAPMDERLVAPSHAALREMFRNASATTIVPLEEFGPAALAARPGWEVLLDGEAVAGLTRVALEGTRGEVGLLGRHPDYRGRGLGRLLLDRALRRLDTFGVTEIVLEVEAKNAQAIQLYRSFGFETTDQTPWYSLSLA